ncbi:SprT family zinc-dependent metalloprotease [Psychromonas sp. B3M02]|uniref:SprT family zinc-dependent metalloprotease n=1 Tax=Psychromonas sp. B3M02 TaxID=2267226 RepID=UPI000DEBC58D|nr:SprT family zinc-dependent metalloprotease [Psychromonas sp. B3M02]RBW43159.1 SprT family zinc-dependent metalloprotease [Psychromonas sp. B3M02]
MLTFEDKKALAAKGEDCFILAECFFDRHFPRPTYYFNQRGRSAGTAHLQKNIIKFNPILYSQNKQIFIEQVVAHEIAHLLTYQMFGKVRPHGKEWQAIMTQVFKVPASTTHQLDVSDVQGKLFTYRCDCSEHQLTIRRHNKIKKGTTYLCRQCKSALMFVEANS